MKDWFYFYILNLFLSIYLLQIIILVWYFLFIENEQSVFNQIGIEEK
jgi:hypothetical protein